MKQKTRKKRIWAWLLVLTLSLGVPAISIEAANEAEISTIAVTESEIQTENSDITEEAKLRQELANSYSRLEEKYQREKTFSRSVIYTLIFVIAVLLVVLINMIFYYRKKLYYTSENILEKDYRKKVEKKQIEEKAQKIETQQIEKKLQKEEKQQAEKKPQKIETQQVEKKLQKKEKQQAEKKTQKTEMWETEEKRKKEKKNTKKVTAKTGTRINNIEVLDFNDED